MNYEIQEKARKKVKSIRRLYIHLSLYVIVGVFFFLLNIVTDPFDMWWFFPMLPWGVAAALHYVLVKGIPGTDVLSKDWEEREYERQLDRLDDSYKYSFLEEPKEDNYLPYRELSKEEIAIIKDGFV